MSIAVLQNPNIRQAVQAAFGVAAAIAAGTVISGQHWYWAVIAAFIVALGVGSRGEAVIKALQRIAGTALGIAVGFALALAVGHDTYLAMALVLGCVFCGFYAFQAAYGTMIFFITVMLALLYGVIGMLTPGVLVVRVEETAAGAAAGLAAVYFVLPIRQSTAFADAGRDFRRALAEAIRSAAACDPGAMKKAVATLQGKTQALRAAIGAARRGWAPLMPRPYREAVRAAMRCSYLLREAAQDGALPQDLAESLAGLVDEGRPGETYANPRSDLQAALVDSVCRLLESLQRAAPRSVGENG